VKDTEDILEDLKNDRVPKAGPRYDVRFILASIKHYAMKAFWGGWGVDV
jgi:hypothetical protein